MFWGGFFFFFLPFASGLSQAVNPYQTKCQGSIPRRTKMITCAGCFPLCRLSLVQQTFSTLLQKQTPVSFAAGVTNSIQKEEKKKKKKKKKRERERERERQILHFTRVLIK